MRGVARRPAAAALVLVLASWMAPSFADAGPRLANGSTSSGEGAGSRDSLAVATTPAAAARVVTNVLGRDAVDLSTRQTPIGPNARPLEIAGVRVQPGSKERIRLRAGQSFVGSDIETTAVVLHGRTPGPTLCLTAGIHGDELNGTETVRRLLARISADELAGNLVGLPIVNVHGFRSRSRFLPDRRDLNRHFPGSPRGSAAARIAHAIFDGVVRHCDALVDFHSGSFHRSSLAQVRGDFTTPTVRALAVGLGAAVALHQPGLDGTLRREATRRTIPAVLYESGESLRLQEAAIEEAERAVLRLLDHLGMRPDAARNNRPDAPELFFDAQWVRVNHGGIFVPAVELGAAVERGTVLATIFDPLGEQRADLRAPAAGRVLGMALPQVVLPGFAAFHVGNRDATLPTTPRAGTDPGAVADFEHGE